MKKSIFVSVVAGLMVAAVAGLFREFRSSAPAFRGSIESGRALPGDVLPDVGAALLDFILENEAGTGKTVRLDLTLDSETTEGLSKIARTGNRTYSLQLTSKDGPWLMDLDLVTRTGDDFYFGVTSPGTGVLRGWFKIVGCAQTGTGWFHCELQGLAPDASRHARYERNKEE